MADNIGIEYDFNVIYNTSEDPKIDKFVDHLIDVLSQNGYNKCYHPVRDVLPGSNIFDEFFMVQKSSARTIVVISKCFRDNWWAKFSQQTSFKCLLEKKNSHKLIPIAIDGVTNDLIPYELSLSNVLYFQDNWSDPKKWNNVIKAMSNNRHCNDLNVEEQHDNRMRSEQQNLTAYPFSETSSLFVADSSGDEDNSIVDTDGPDAIRGALAPDGGMVEVHMGNASALESSSNSTGSNNGNTQPEQGSGSRKFLPSFASTIINILINNISRPELAYQGSS